jgi:hypothetical protein
MEDLTKALVETGATLAFDAIGGGKLASQILTCMEAAASKTAKVYSRYGSTVHKQVYNYGSLDPRPIELDRAFGMAWGVGGWLHYHSRYTQKKTRRRDRRAKLYDAKRERSFPPSPHDPAVRDLHYATHVGEALHAATERDILSASGTSHFLFLTGSVAERASIGFLPSEVVPVV